MHPTKRRKRKMTAFDTLVEQVISQNTDYPTLRTVIEKELLHYDILRCMSEAGFLKNLTFMGGTCLRDCYGSVRLSEDLDFTGGFDFSKNSRREESTNNQVSDSRGHPNRLYIFCKSKIYRLYRGIWHLSHQ